MYINSMPRSHSRRLHACHSSFSTSLIRGASPLGLPYTLSRAPLRRRAPFAWLARHARSQPTTDVQVYETASSLLISMNVDSPGWCDDARCAMSFKSPNKALFSLNRLTLEIFPDKWTAAGSAAAAGDRDRHRRRQRLAVVSPQPRQRGRLEELRLSTGRAFQVRRQFSPPVMPAPRPAPVRRARAGR